VSSSTPKACSLVGLEEQAISSAPKACGLLFHHPRRKARGDELVVNALPLYGEGGMRPSLWRRYWKYSGLTRRLSTSSITGKK